MYRPSSFIFYIYLLHMVRRHQHHRRHRPHRLLQYLFRFLLFFFFLFPVSFRFFLAKIKKYFFSPFRTFPFSVLPFPFFVFVFDLEWIYFLRILLHWVASGCLNASISTASVLSDLRILRDLLRVKVTR